MKLMNLSITYKVDKPHGVVVARVENMTSTSIFRFSARTIVGIGIARATQEVFDEETGKRLARARAEKDAYIKYRQLIQKFTKSTRLELDELRRALDHANSCIERQKEYIKSF